VGLQSRVGRALRRRGLHTTDDADQRPGDELADVQAQIATLIEAQRTREDVDNERALLRARHAAGARLVDTASSAPQFITSELAELPPEVMPGFTPEALTPELLRAAILRDGCVLVRGLVPRGWAEEFAAKIDRAFDERLRVGAGQAADPRYYDEFQPHERFGPVDSRLWITAGGGLLAADSPMLSFEMTEMFNQVGLPALVSAYLGEPALISVHKTTLRKAEPSVSGAWHQDGAFMGPVRALNLWLSLSRCGDEAPGLDIVPRQLGEYVASGTEGADLSWTISDQQVNAAAGEAGVVRPIFEPGDALLFDEVFLHKTGSSPEMPKPRYAIENWFFGASAFPTEYAPIAI
jgi:phytanoyl-CoA dioxygenase PhyH